MTWILDQPLYIAILGVLTLAILAFGWMQTGYRALLHGMIGVAALTAGLLLLERWVETDAEQVETTLRKIGKVVESNDLDAILSYVYSGAPDTLREAQAEFPKYRFSNVNIKRNLEVEVDNSAQPPKAFATFNVGVNITEVSSGVPYVVRRYVEITMRKENGQWKVEKYEHHEPHAGMMIDPDQ